MSAVGARPTGSFTAAKTHLWTLTPSLALPNFRHSFTPSTASFRQVIFADEPHDLVEWSLTALVRETG